MMYPNTTTPQLTSHIKYTSVVPQRRVCTPRMGARLLWSRTRFSISDIPTIPTEVSHAVINFTFLYSTMNWLYYRGIRKRIEKEKKDKKK